MQIDTIELPNRANRMKCSSVEHCDWLISFVRSFHSVWCGPHSGRLSFYFSSRRPSSCVFVCSALAAINNKWIPNKSIFFTVPTLNPDWDFSHIFFLLLQRQSDYVREHRLLIKEGKHVWKRTKKRVIRTRMGYGVRRHRRASQTTSKPKSCRIFVVAKKKTDSIKIYSLDPLSDGREFMRCGRLGSRDLIEIETCWRWLITILNYDANRQRQMWSERTRLTADPPFTTQFSIWISPQIK